MQKKISSVYSSCILANTVSYFTSVATEFICAWLLSKVLSFIMEYQWDNSRKMTGIVIICLLAGSVLIYVTGRWSRQTVATSRERYREELCENIIKQSRWFPSDGEFYARMETDAETITKFFSIACPQSVISVGEMLLSFILLTVLYSWIGPIFLR